MEEFLDPRSGRRELHTGFWATDVAGLEVVTAHDGVTVERFSQSSRQDQHLLARAKLLPDDPEVLLGPITGFRVWTVGRGLCSTYSVEWPFGGPLEADCRPQRYSSMPHYPAPHAAPDRRCSCGIYAMKDRPALAAELVGHYGGLGEGDAVVGEVRLWGQVYEHERGWRAEYATPQALYRMWRSSDVELRMHALARVYDIPILDPPPEFAVQSRREEAARQIGNVLISGNRYLPRYLPPAALPSHPSLGRPPGPPPGPPNPLPLRPLPPRPRPLPYMQARALYEATERELRRSERRRRWGPRLLAFATAAGLMAGWVGMVLWLPRLAFAVGSGAVAMGIATLARRMLRS